MALKTVRVPEALEGQFAEVEKLVSRYFLDRKDDPAHGTIEIFGERYVLVRAASLSVEFFSLVGDLYGPGREVEADEFARNILFDLAHAIGKSDAHNFHAKMDLTDPIARLSAGPIHFAHAGWAFVDISPESRPSPDEDYFLVYDHPYSFESDAWLRAKQRRDFPVCIMNAGYSSGWCEESFGVTLVATEVLCRARGDAACRFVMAHPSRIETSVERYLAGASRGAVTPSYQIPDFFARKRTEEELRRTRDELEERVVERTAALTAEIAERTQMERQLLQAQKLEAVGRLAGGIAHDFNNLMAVIIGNAGLLGSRLPGDSPLRAFADEITSAGKRAAALTQQLLTFSRTNVLAREVVDINQIVGELGRMLHRVIGEDVELTVTLGNGVGCVMADRGQIEQVVMNLVVNARDAVASGGSVTVETSRVDLAAAIATDLGTLAPGRYVVLSVRDTGVGMDDGTKAQIFDPFFTTKTAGKGTGLGLSTVYGIVKQAGGGVTVESAPGKGARFAIYVPRVEATATTRISERRMLAVVLGTETILVVEDQEQLRTVIVRALRDSGYTVIGAGDAADAIELAARHAGPIHLLLTDVIMPRMHGPELAKHLLAARPDMRVVFMSGYTDGASLEDGAELLAKPFATDVLGRKVREVLDARPPAK